MTPILESLVHKGMSIREFKEQIITEAYKQRVDLPLTVDRCASGNTPHKYCPIP